MNKPPRIGASHELTFTVGTADCIDFASDTLPPVLSTPALISKLERTARECLAPFAEPGEQSLGTELDLKHLAPTPQGATVRCQARIIQAEGALVSFQVEAHDEFETIARGFHRRAVVRVDRFARRVERKRA